MCNVKTGLALLLFIISQVSSTGVFKLELTRFTNDFGLLNDRSCCAGQQIGNTCTEECNTYFTICLKHYQVDISSGNCLFGQFTTEPLGNNTFNFPQSKSPFTNPLRFNITYKWPGDFSLIIEAHHESRTTKESSRIGTFQGSSIGRALPSDDWKSVQWNSSNTEHQQSLQLKYEIECHPGYFGDGCSKICRGRDDDIGHYECDTQGERVCLQGWKGAYCTEPVCLDGCSREHGSCLEPNECSCKVGWQGRLCDQCIRYPGCGNGYCTKAFNCACFEGWGGLFCNQDLNFCTNNRPCQNGGTCTNTGEGAYTCTCPIGFTGKNCETEVDNCRIQPCENGGTCQDVGNDFTCRCPLGFGGARCEIISDHCNNNPCSNGGTCEPIGDSFRCQCAPGYHGVNCAQNINECNTMDGGIQTTLCQNGGSCIDGIDSYSCACPTGFTGQHCEISDQECVGENPCQNNGTCQKNGDGFICRCKPGFIGAICSSQVNECLTMPCANGGTCVDQINSFQCICAPGFAGRMCGEKVNECDSNPCRYGGTCSDAHDGYTCHCTSAYEGKRCEHERGSAPSPTPRLRPTTKLSISTTGTSNLVEDDTKVGAVQGAQETTDTNTDVKFTQSQLILIVCLGSGIPMGLLLVLVVVLLCRRCKKRVEDTKEEIHQNEINSMNNRIHNPVKSVNGKGDDEYYSTSEKVINDLDTPTSPQKNKNSAAETPSAKVLHKELLKDINTNKERQLLDGNSVRQSQHQPLTPSVEQYLQYFQQQERQCSSPITTNAGDNTNNSNNANITTISSSVRSQYQRQQQSATAHLPDIISRSQQEPEFRHSELSPYHGQQREPLPTYHTATGSGASRYNATTV